MAVGIVLLGYFFILRKKFSVAGYLILFIISTVFLAYLIDKTPRFIEFKDYFNITYTVLLLFIIVSSFKGYHSIKSIGEFSNQNKILIVSRIVLILGIIALICNSYIVFKSISLIFIDAVDIQSYKNEGGADEMIKTWIPQSLLTFTHLISPLAYISFSLHFYFLIKGDIKKSIIFLLISLNIPLHGLHGLSRFAPSQFILIYFFTLVYVFPALNKKMKNRILIIAGTFIFSILSILTILTTSRFEESSYYDSRIPYDSKIQNKSLFSVVDYLSQWNYQNIEVLRDFSYDKIWYGKASTPAIAMFLKKISANDETLIEVRQRTLGKNSSAFNGLIATLVYDFGYILAFILVLLYHYIVKSNKPKKGIVSFPNFTVFSILISIPALAFTNNIMSTLIFNIAIIYVVILFLFFKIKFPKNNMFYTHNQSQLTKL